jgi:hypothetical protein
MRPKTASSVIVDKVAGSELVGNSDTFINDVTAPAGTYLYGRRMSGGCGVVGIGRRPW